MSSGFFLVAGVGLEPHDLRVMSPTSYQLLHPAMSVPQEQLYFTPVLRICQVSFQKRAFCTKFHSFSNDYKTFA